MITCQSNNLVNCISCIWCPTILYIGETGRSLGSRFNKHLNMKYMQQHHWVSCGPTFQLSFSAGFSSIKCHLASSICFKLGTDGWYWELYKRQDSLVFFFSLWEGWSSVLKVYFWVLGSLSREGLPWSLKEFVLSSLRPSPLTNLLLTWVGWHEVKCMHWKVSVGVRWVRTSSIDSLLNLLSL